MPVTPISHKPIALHGLGWLLLILPVVLAGCGRPSQAVEMPSEINVKVAVPVTKRVVEWDEYTARLEAVEFVEVRARVGGYLQSIHFTEGQIVKEGDLLVVIDPRPFAAAVKRAEADLAQARAQHTEATSQLAQSEAQKKEAGARLDLSRKRMQRAKALIAKSAISTDEFQLQESELVQAEAAVESAESRILTTRAAIDTAAAAIDTAQAALEIAQIDLSYTEVRAPVTGRVSNRLITEGNLVSGGSTQASLLTTIVSLDPIHVYFDADEAAFLKYQRLAEEGKRQSSREARNPVYIALADEEGYPHKGHMDFVDNRIDQNTGTMRGRAILRNADLALTPGLFARLRLPGSAAYDAILLPDLAVNSDQSEKFVYVVEDDGTIRRQVVKIGPIVHGLRVIREGLQGSEKVMTQGIQRVRPGVKAKYTVEQIEVRNGDGLPTDYQPVPKEEWITFSSPRSVPSHSAANQGVAGVEQSESPVAKPQVPEARHTEPQVPESSGAAGPTKDHPIFNPPGDFSRTAVAPTNSRLN